MADTLNRGLSNTGQQPRHAGQGGRQEEASGVLGSVVEGAQNVASSVGSTVAGAAGQAWDTTRNVASSVGSTVADYAETAYDSTTNFMRRYPFATLAIGFGLGFLVCMAFQSKRA
jgi:ElaB/YqjD/DUF883 family membrane-anchored ribosome-binding protein